MRTVRDLIAALKGNEDVEVRIAVPIRRSPGYEEYSIDDVVLHDNISEDGEEGFIVHICPVGIFSPPKTRKARRV